ncbi:MAG: DUF4398 domain-containing protein [Oligoflexia bacterium]|nr:DUF4398 domain-containing protein [Oligoflexia bacterium]
MLSLRSNFVVLLPVILKLSTSIKSIVLANPEPFRLRVFCLFSNVLRKILKVVPALWVGMIFLFITGCGLAVTRPKLELSLAQAAFVAAKDAKAYTVAPGLYRKAEVYFLKAKSAYRRKYFNKAKQYAILSKQYSEKAEYMAAKHSMEQK